MPFRSKKQAKFMFAAAGNPRMARKLGIKQSAAKKFVDDSAGQKVGKLPSRVKKRG